MHSKVNTLILLNAIGFLVNSWRCLYIFLIFWCCSNVYCQESIIPANSNSFITAELFEYDANHEIIRARHNIKIIYDDFTITCKELIYDINQDLLWASGDVLITDNSDRVSYGSNLFLYDKLKVAIIKDFALRLNNENLIVAKLAKRIDENNIILSQTCFTNCKADINHQPIWHFSAKKAHIDYQKKRVTYNNLLFKIYNIPVFFSPYFFHPTPDAPAQSGLLMPDYKRSSLGIGIYFRYKPNIDFTITPRIGKNKLLEFEARHRLTTGLYQINGSYTKSRYTKTNTDITISDKTTTRYHIFANGDFIYNDTNYGFNLKHTSDKAYLKNYYNMHDNYLTSKLYLHNVNKGNYLKVETLHFQGLTIADSSKTDPIIFPQLDMRKIIDLKENASLQLMNSTHSSILHQEGGRRLLRIANELSIRDRIITDKGHLFGITAGARGDLYSLYNIYSDISNNKHKQQNLTRAIPFTKLSWQYPFLVRLHKNYLLLEPIITTSTTRSLHATDKKFILIDNNQLELSEYNLFNNNRYAGIDYHEFGKELSYGLNSTLSHNNNYFKLFLGQLYKIDNKHSNLSKNFIGRIDLSMGNNSLIYRFRKDKQWTSIMDEVTYIQTINKMSLSLGFIHLNMIDKYYTPEHTSKIFSTHNHLNAPSPSLDTPKKYIKQIYARVNYNITNNLLIGTYIHAEFKKNKIPMLYRGVNASYSFDCIAITGNVYDDYTMDNLRGITKGTTKTISLGLKGLNI